jgi:hypothetical protein
MLAIVICDQLITIGARLPIDKLTIGYQVVIRGD